MATAGTPRGQMPRGEGGSVTAEFAVGLPGVVATIMLALGALLAGATHVECQEAARVGAREVMLYGSPESAPGAAKRVAGERASVTVTSEGKWVTVHVRKSLFVQGFPIRVAAQMTAPLEGEGVP